MDNPVTTKIQYIQISAFLTLWSEFQAKTSEAMSRVISKKPGKILWSSRERIQTDFNSWKLILKTTWDFLYW